MTEMCSVYDDLDRAIAALKRGSDDFREAVEAMERSRIERRARMMAAFDARLDAALTRAKATTQMGE